MIREVWHAVFGEDITSKKRIAANTFRTLCPYHLENSPSCDVNTEKNVFICRSCGTSGGYLDVVVKAGYVNDRRQARIWLERRGVQC